MNIINRAINILTKPKSEWAVIDSEPATVGGLFTGYAMILALLPLVGTLLASVVAMGQYAGLGITFFIVTGVVAYVIGLGILYLMGIIADALAGSFDGTKSDISAMKLVVYSATPMWIAGFFGFIPGISILISLAGFAYAAYLLYLGSMQVMKIPEGKAIGYTAVVIIIWIILSIVIGTMIVGAIILSMLGGAAMGGAYYN